jgi:transposase
MDKRVITARDTRRKHNDAFKRGLVERSLQPGASVAAIAQESGINANLLFNWRRLHIRRAGAMAATEMTPSSTKLLPVVIEEHPAPTTGTSPTSPSRAAPTGVIEIDIGGVRVRLRGIVDSAAVRCVLQTLRSTA